MIAKLKDFIYIVWVGFQVILWSPFALIIGVLGIISITPEAYIIPLAILLTFCGAIGLLYIIGKEHIRVSEILRTRDGR